MIRWDSVVTYTDQSSKKSGLNWNTKYQIILLCFRQKRSSRKPVPRKRIRTKISDAVASFSQTPWLARTSSRSFENQDTHKGKEVENIISVVLCPLKRERRKEVRIVCGLSNGWLLYVFPNNLHRVKTSCFWQNGVGLIGFIGITDRIRIWSKKGITDRNILTKKK